MVKYKAYRTKKILNTHKHVDGGWYWVKYSAHPYLGCEYGCEYCYARDKHYCPYENPNDFDKLIKVKENAAELLKKELTKVAKDLIAVGDWQPVENKYHLSRAMLEVCLELGFPVFILEKSPLVVQDLDLLKKINKKAGVIASFSIITTKDNQVRKIFEPKAPPIKARFAAMKKMRQAGLFVGTEFMPTLPFIYDNEENIEQVVKMTKEFGGQFVLAGGLTLWGEVKDYYYQVLQKYYPSLVIKYDEIFESKQAFDTYWQPVTAKVEEMCQKYEIHDYIPRLIKYFPKDLQFNKEVAAKWHLKAKEYQDTGRSSYREWAYRKAAWEIDEMKESLIDIYQKSWLKGIMKIPNVGNRLAHEIEKEIQLTVDH